MTRQGRKRSRVARLVATVFVVSTTAPLGLPQARSALQQAGPPPPKPKPTETAPKPSGNASQEDDTKKEKKNHSSDTADKPPKLVLVVSKRNPVESLKIDELRRIFLRKKTHWRDGSSITVYERSVDHQIRNEFSKRVFEKKPSELNEYWMNLQLTRGLKPPKVLRSAKLVKRYLQRVRGGIGYLYEDEVDDTVKVIEIKVNKIKEPKRG